MSALDKITLLAFFDGELDPATARGVAEVISHDPAAQETVRRLRQSAMLVRKVFERPAYRDVPPQLAKMLEGPKRRTRWRFALPIAASFLIVAIGFGSGIGIGRMSASPTTSFSDRLLADIAEYHVVYAQEGEHQVEVPGDQRAHIQDWFGSRLHRQLRVPDLSGRGLSFVGARLLVVDGAPVAQLLYRWPGLDHEPLALCVTYGAPGDRGLRADERNGLHQVLWRHHGYTYVLVGWTSEDFLASVANEIMPGLDKIS
ncbi:MULTISPECIES: anti-sigma factor [unclassified Acidisoma]|jgi:anti-sigma factor RsiW|uniref:anti-sigma factor family protein n=1 Tax=unclassified Acidisoma TaxID=2634065 RepID=UPI00131C8F54|nr:MULTISPECIES: anti-sigma factor [unclassified Acidisoma]